MTNAERRVVEAALRWQKAKEENTYRDERDAVENATFDLQSAVNNLIRSQDVRLR